MQAGTIAFAYGRGGRHLRFITLISVLALIDLWLWARLALWTADGPALLRGEMAIALAVGTSAIVAIYALWRHPLSRNDRMMTTPLLRHSLATHRAGHIVAAYLEDPARVTMTTLSEPCARQPRHAPAITETALRSELTIALAGLAAEEIFAGESGSHAAADLARATTIAADMVGRYGMAGSLVSLATAQPKRAEFIDRVLDDARTRKELEALLRDAKRDTMRMMLQHRHVIIELREALTRHRRLGATRIRQLIKNAAEARQADDTVLVDLRPVTDRARPLSDASKM